MMRFPSAVPALILAACAAGCGGAGRHARARAELQPWSEFVTLLRAGPLPADRMKPFMESLRAPLQGFLATMSRKADWSEWRREPEVFRVGDEVHYILPLTYDGQRKTFCFSFLVENGHWYFEHFESITIRMDRLGPLPARSFPDLPEKDKVWMREEWEVSREIGFYNALAAAKSQTAALAWFNDGAGYALTARAWVPFVSTARAFVLYLCWEQANLRGGDVVLERLDDTLAVVRLRPLYLQLYEQTGHLKQQIGADAYRVLFETRWRDRASAAGWHLDLVCRAGDCVFRFTRAAT